MTLTVAQMPSHNHNLRASSKVGSRTSPGGTIPAVANDGESNYAPVSDANTNAQPTVNSGSSQSHNNMPPFLTINFVVALVGLYPSRN